MNTDRSFLGKLRQQFLELCMEREIFNKIFPHLNREQDHGYSFGSDEELLNEIRQGAVAVRTNFNLIERLARQMPKAYGEAFRYIVQRDLNHRMQMYLKLARRRVQQKTCDPRFVAVKA